MMNQKASIGIALFVILLILFLIVAERKTSQNDSNVANSNAEWRLFSDEITGKSYSLFLPENFTKEEFMGAKKYFINN